MCCADLMGVVSLMYTHEYKYSENLFWAKISAIYIHGNLNFQNETITVYIFCIYMQGLLSYIWPIYMALRRFLLHVKNKKNKLLMIVTGLSVCACPHTHTDVDDDAAVILHELDGLQSEYFTLGIHLHLPPGKVSTIQEDNPHNSRSAIGKVITEWLMMNYKHNEFGKPSWRLLVEAVSTVDLERAKIIANNHKVNFNLKL